MDDIFLQLLKDKLKDSEERRKLLLHALEYLRSYESAGRNTPQKGVHLILETVAELGCPPNPKKKT